MFKNHTFLRYWFLAATFSSFTTDAIPFAMPVISNSDGTTCATTISAQNPRNTHTKIPLASSRTPVAAHAVAGAKIPINVAGTLMTSSFCQFVVCLIADVNVTALLMPISKRYIY
jgi:hypothetical protein